MSATNVADGLATLSRQLGYDFADLTLLRRALAHRSWCAEVGGQPSNERLEFLGDAVLGWVVAEIAYRRHGDLPEGKLTDLRKSVVNATALAEVAETIGLGEWLLLGKGEDAAEAARNRRSCRMRSKPCWVRYISTAASTQQRPWYRGCSASDSRPQPANSIDWITRPSCKS